MTPEDRRTWLIAARKTHDLTRDQAAYLVEQRRKGKLGPAEQVARMIEMRLARRGLSQPDLALLMDCSQNEISKIETGERQRPNPKYVAALARILRMTRDEVLYGSPQPTIVWILGKMQGDEVIHLLEQGERCQLNGFTPDADTIGYKVAVNTLEPRWRLGDIILVRGAGHALEECIGLECVVEIEGRRYVGLVEAGASPRVITLRPSRSSNPTLIDRTPTWIGPIIAICPSG